MDIQTAKTEIQRILKEITPQVTIVNSSADIGGSYADVTQGSTTIRLPIFDSSGGRGSTRVR